MGVNQTWRRVSSRDRAAIAFDNGRSNCLVHNLSHHRLPSGLRTDSTDFTTGPVDFTTGPFLLSISVFVFSFFVTVFLFGSVRQIKLAIRQLLGTAHVNIVHRVYRIVSEMTERKENTSSRYVSAGGLAIRRCYAGLDDFCVTVGTAVQTPPQCTKISSSIKINENSSITIAR